jgi:hypothetical protein
MVKDLGRYAYGSLRRWIVSVWDMQLKISEALKTFKPDSCTATSPVRAPA